jgi:hypothetical protein
MPTGKDLIEEMGLDYQEVLEADETRERGRPKSKTICLCGHALSRHEDMGDGRAPCNALMRNCRCRNPIAVLETEDVRVFMSKTEGGAALHALTRGLLAANKKGIEVSWIDEQRYCHSCETTDTRLTPVAVTRNGLPATEDTGYNALLCDDCRLRG